MPPQKSLRQVLDLSLILSNLKAPDLEKETFQVTGAGFSQHNVPASVLKPELGPAIHSSGKDQPSPTDHVKQGLQSNTNASKWDLVSSSNLEDSTDSGDSGNTSFKFLFENDARLPWNLPEASQTSGSCRHSYLLWDHHDLKRVI